MWQNFRFIFATLLQNTIFVPLIILIQVSFNETFQNAAYGFAVLYLVSKFA
jgi:hypothetical protein